MLLVLGTIEVHPEDVETAIKVARTMAEATLKEPGCKQYAFARDITQANKFLLTEQWADAEALAAHFGTPHMAEFQGAMATLRIQHLVATRYDVANEVELIRR